MVSAKVKSARWRQERTWIYKIIEVIGPWAMLDVFLLSVLVALVRLEQLATVLPGPGLLAFAAVVILTIFASASFDPKLIWDELDKAPCTELPLPPLTIRKPRLLRTEWCFRFMTNRKRNGWSGLRRYRFHRRNSRWLMPASSFDFFSRAWTSSVDHSAEQTMGACSIHRIMMT